MTNTIDGTKLADLVYASIITVPGVAGFAKVDEKGNDDEHVTMLVKDYSQSIKLRQEGRNCYIDIFLILLEGVNIKDVGQEVQIRIKYELEKSDLFPSDFTIYVNVSVQDLLI